MGKRPTLRGKILQAYFELYTVLGHEAEEAKELAFKRMDDIKGNQITERTLAKVLAQVSTEAKKPKAKGRMPPGLGKRLQEAQQKSRRIRRPK